jgi:hypothetical protein
MEQWWNYDLARGKPKKNLPSATLSTTHPTWIDLDTNPDLHGERLATICLSHGTALTSIKLTKPIIDLYV